MPGVEVINIYEVSNLNLFAFWFAFCAIFLAGFASIGMAISCFTEKIVSLKSRIIFGLLFLLISSYCFISAFEILNSKDKVIKTQYEVEVNESVRYNDFMSKYVIIEERGNGIVIVEEREK